MFISILFTFATTTVKIYLEFSENELFEKMKGIVAIVSTLKNYQSHSFNWILEVKLSNGNVLEKLIKKEKSKSDNTGETINSDNLIIICIRFMYCITVLRAMHEPWFRCVLSLCQMLVGEKEYVILNGNLFYYFFFRFYECRWAKWFHVCISVMNNRILFHFSRWKCFKHLISNRI